jgi:hypothetical protein
MSSYSHVQGHAFRRLLAASSAAEEQASSPADDLKLFATFWLGGLVFFGTFLA